MKRKMDVWYKSVCRYPDICVNASIIKCLSLCDIIGRRERVRVGTNSTRTYSTQSPQTGTGLGVNLAPTRAEVPDNPDPSALLEPFPTGILSSITITAELNLKSIDETSAMTSPLRPVELQLESVNKHSAKVKTLKKQETKEQDFREIFGLDFDKAVEMVLEETEKS